MVKIFYYQNCYQNKTRIQIIIIHTFSARMIRGLDCPLYFIFGNFLSKIGFQILKTIIISISFEIEEELSVKCI